MAHSPIHRFSSRITVLFVKLIIILLQLRLSTDVVLVVKSFTITTRINKHHFHHHHRTSTNLQAMKRPILDQIATTLFNLEQKRVQSSSIIDSKGRIGEPMEWSEKNSLPNLFSEYIASNTIGYRMKQFIADMIAGNDYDQQYIQNEIDNFITSDKVVLFSFTSCPFCRQAKDYFDENNITYNVMELDLLEGNKGNEIRAMLGKMTKRTSVPSIFINGNAIGGLNDGMPGLMPLVESGELETMLLL